MEKEALSFEKYQYGALAGRLASLEDSARFAPSALEILAGSKGLNLGEEALGFIKGTQASEEGIKTAIQTYAGQFEKKRAEYKPAELAEWYAPVLKGLDEAEVTKILATLNEHDETINSIKEGYNRADYILKAPKGLFNEEQLANAKKTKEKYEKTLLVMQTLDNYKFETLRTDAVDETRKADLKGLASKL
ncbi:MAG: hypothetical protein NTW17_00215 [Candidatus Pacearchaeota archaeon]|nr:hypothetical protein [Candidatus Pacearchaeota archaeon]